MRKCWGGSLPPSFSKQSNWEHPLTSPNLLIGLLQKMYISNTHLSVHGALVRQLLPYSTVHVPITDQRVMARLGQLGQWDAEETVPSMRLTLCLLGLLLGLCLGQLLFSLPLLFFTLKNTTQGRGNRHGRTSFAGASPEKNGEPLSSRGSWSLRR